MWDPLSDLDHVGKAVPCNLTVTFQIQDGVLNMVVFCRSNDIVWGCYGANAVHFSFLLEYVAVNIGVRIGTYTQVSVNWHAYVDHWHQVCDIQPCANPYLVNESVRHLPIAEPVSFDRELNNLLICEEQGFPSEMSSYPSGFQFEDEWWNTIYAMLTAHARWRSAPYPQRTELALKELSRSEVPQDADWIVAAKQWIERRQQHWEEKQTETKVNV